MTKRIWLISDTHFGHKKMQLYCSRPKNFESLIFKNLSVVKPGDLLIHLGDFCIGRDKYWHKEFFKQIPNVTTVLLRGNHDKKTNFWYLDNGWSFVAEVFDGNFFGKYISFSHIPIKKPIGINIHGHYHNHLPRLLDGIFVVEGEKERNNSDFKLSLYDKRIHRLISMEDTNFRPVLLDCFLREKV